MVAGRDTRVRTLIGAIAVVMLTAAACSGATSSSGNATAPPPPPTPTASAVPTALPAAPPVDVEAAPIDPRVEARLELPGGPDRLAVSDGSVWVKKDDGIVVRIDPDGTREVASIKVADELCSGLGADDSAVWSCADGGVARIDPTTNTVGATFEVDKFGDQGQIPVAFGRVWVLVGDGSTLIGIVDDAVDVQVDLKTRCNELAASNTAIWAACLDDGAAVAVDPERAAIVARVLGLEGSRHVAVGSDVWVGFDGGVARIDEASGRVTGVADAPTGFGGGLAATSDDVWVRTGGRFLRRVDAETMEVTEDLQAPEVSGGSALVAFDSVWATAYDDAVLYRVALEP